MHRVVRRHLFEIEDLRGYGILVFATIIPGPIINCLHACESHLRARLTFDELILVLGFIRMNLPRWVEQLVSVLVRLARLRLSMNMDLLHDSRPVRGACSFDISGLDVLGVWHALIGGAAVVSWDA